LKVIVLSKTADFAEVLLPCAADDYRTFSDLLYQALAPSAVFA